MLKKYNLPSRLFVRDPFARRPPPPPANPELERGRIAEEMVDPAGEPPQAVSQNEALCGASEGGTDGATGDSVPESSQNEPAGKAGGARGGQGKSRVRRNEALCGASEGAAGGAKGDFVPAAKQNEPAGDPGGARGNAAAPVSRNEALCGASAGARGGEVGEMGEHTLTPAQLRAIGLILVGRSTACVARTVGVSRATVFRWRRQPNFAAALRARQAMLCEQAIDGLRVVMLQAVKEIRRDLQSPRPHVRNAAAYRLLPYIGSPKLRVQPVENGG